MTLLTAIPTTAELPPLVDALSSALRDVEPFDLTYTDLDSHGTFFQYLFVAVDKSEQLAALRHRVRSALLPRLPAEVPSDYFPHLSLMYGVDNETRRVQEIIEGLQGKEEVRRGAGFRAESVLLVKCEGPPAEWQVLETVRLQR